MKYFARQICCTLRIPRYLCSCSSFTFGYLTIPFKNGAFGRQWRFDDVLTKCIWFLRVRSPKRTLTQHLSFPPHHPSVYLHPSLVGVATTLKKLPAMFQFIYFQKFKIRIEAPPSRKHMVFLGGAVLANLMKDRDQDFWVSKKEYEEGGIARCMAKLGIKA